ncbi:two component transcriptional regulator, LuxR family [Saccharicrinis carchari]|uniref:Two component transcriptional regulator, LuxR family n=1 Tax=Saccharicrinis carchari TaxID=1168039 RepID=A0A521C6U3_SACCC|nr:response regulator transcription factor [Saccharicrinis carchari]SMO55134.1 two component transcriptional regulator, LuxR family [Saccharicrinis carchari]
MIKIVIVEDHEMVREGLKVLINQWSDMNIVAEYSTGAEWLDNIGMIEGDVVLIDINMPNMDGLTAISQALTIDTAIKVIVLSMHNDSNYFREAFVAGAKGYLLKQLSAQDLEKAIREVYKGNTYFSDEFLLKVAKSIKRGQDKSVETTKGNISLSDQERQLLRNVCKGYTNKQIAESMFLSVKTIESQKSKLMKRSNSKNNASLIVWAIKNQIVDL